MSNILTTILRPNFHEPLRSPKDLVENNVRVFDTPGFGYLAEIMSLSPDPWVQVCELYVNLKILKNLECITCFWP